MSKLAILPGTGERNPDAILEIAKGLSDVTVIGWRDDDTFYFASSYEYCKDTLWDLEQAKRVLIET